MIERKFHFNLLIKDARPRLLLTIGIDSREGAKFIFMPNSFRPLYYILINPNKSEQIFDKNQMTFHQAKDANDILREQKSNLRWTLDRDDSIDPSEIHFREDLDEEERQFNQEAGY